MKAIKLTTEQYNRSLRSGLNHLWLYRRQETSQRTHNNSIFLGRTVGEPFGCLVIEYNSDISDSDLEKLFGIGTFTDGAVSPDDKQNMRWDSFYIKN
jgi:hypothetical protein